jgi:crotonobetainyl-CoA:carnitine CoA-transferase CaiB-like acyl-CoA transferase
VHLRVVRDLAHWRTVLDAAGITFGIVGTLEEVADDAQMHAIGALARSADGAHLMVMNPLRIDGAPHATPRAAPALGEHGTAVLREAGYSDAEITRLRTLRVLA